MRQFKFGVLLLIAGLCAAKDYDYVEEDGQSSEETFEDEAIEEQANITPQDGSFIDYKVDQAVNMGYNDPLSAPPMDDAAYWESIYGTEDVPDFDEPPAIKGDTLILDSVDNWDGNDDESVLTKRTATYPNYNFESAQGLSSSVGQMLFQSSGMKNCNAKNRGVFDLPQQSTNMNYQQTLDNVQAPHSLASSEPRNPFLPFLLSKEHGNCYSSSLSSRSHDAEIKKSTINSNRNTHSNAYLNLRSSGMESDDVGKAYVTKYIPWSEMPQVDINVDSGCEEGDDDVQSRILKDGDGYPIHVNVPIDHLSTAYRESVNDDTDYIDESSNVDTLQLGKSITGSTSGIQISQRPKSKHIVPSDGREAGKITGDFLSTSEQSSAKLVNAKDSAIDSTQKSINSKMGPKSSDLGSKMIHSAGKLIQSNDGRLTMSATKQSGNTLSNLESDDIGCTKCKLCSVNSEIDLAPDTTADKLIHLSKIDSTIGGYDGSLVDATKDQLVRMNEGSPTSLLKDSADTFVADEELSGTNMKNQGGGLETSLESETKHDAFENNSGQTSKNDQMNSEETLMNDTEATRNTHQSKKKVASVNSVPADNAFDIEKKVSKDDEVVKSDIGNTGNGCSCTASQLDGGTISGTIDSLTNIAKGENIISGVIGAEKEIQEEVFKEAVSRGTKLVEGIIELAAEEFRMDKNPDIKQKIIALAVSTIEKVVAGVAQETAKEITKVAEAGDKLISDKEHNIGVIAKVVEAGDKSLSGKVHNIGEKTKVVEAGDKLLSGKVHNIGEITKVVEAGEKIISDKIHNIADIKVADVGKTSISDKSNGVAKITASGNNCDTRQHAANVGIQSITNSKITTTGSLVSTHERKSETHNSRSYGKTHERAEHPSVYESGSRTDTKGYQYSKNNQQQSQQTHRASTSGIPTHSYTDEYDDVFFGGKNLYHFEDSTEGVHRPTDYDTAGRYQNEREVSNRSINLDTNCNEKTMFSPECKWLNSDLRHPEEEGTPIPLRTIKMYLGHGQKLAVGMHDRAQWLLNGGIHTKPHTAAMLQFINSMANKQISMINQKSEYTLFGTKLLQHKLSAEYNITPNTFLEFLRHHAFQVTGNGVCQSSKRPKRCSSEKYRSFDGSCNNILEPTWGQSKTAFTRLLPARYSDGVHSVPTSVTGEELPNARELSVRFFAHKNVSDPRYTLALSQWGQLLSHDFAFQTMDQGPENGIECCADNGSDQLPKSLQHHACLPIDVSPKDKFYSKYGVRCLNLVRSMTVSKEDCTLGPAEQMNSVTSYLDCSPVYGVDKATSDSLRTFSGGRMTTEIRRGRQMLPTTSDKSLFCDIMSPSEVCYQSGDMRINQNPHLAILQTVLLREHNRIAMELERLNPHWNDERLFQESRRITIAEYQHITYYEWLPYTIGKNYCRKHRVANYGEGMSKDYNPKVNAGTINAFTTAAFRYFHSMVEGNLNLCPRGREISHTLRLSNHYFRPQVIERSNNFDELLRGLFTQPMQRADANIHAELTNYLFRSQNEHGSDLITIDIQRSRDHGLRGYNAYRRICRLKHAKKFDDLANEIRPERLEKLKRAYAHVDDIDLMIGASMESHIPGTLLGPTFQCIISEQFYRSRIGDRYFYDNVNFTHSFTHAQFMEIKKASMARLVCAAGDDISNIQRQAFKVISVRNPVVSCKNLPKLNLSLWKE